MQCMICKYYKFNIDNHNLGRCLKARPTRNQKNTPLYKPIVFATESCTDWELTLNDEIQENTLKNLQKKKFDINNYYTVLDLESDQQQTANMIKLLKKTTIPNKQ